MPCNLAVSITKAQVSDEQLARLLDADMAEQAARLYLTETLGLQERQGSFNTHDYSRNPSEPLPYFSIQRVTSDTRGQPATIQARIGGYYGVDVFIQGATVRVNGTSRQHTAYCQRVSAEMAATLGQMVDMVFAAQVEQALRQLGNVRSEVASVEDMGQRVTATKLTLRI